jgi:metal-responsive CopG/Arc/MetJ family transcriptional regulator
MKVHVSIPDEILQKADRLARRTKRSRSALFTDALREYLDRRAPGKLTQALDSTVAKIKSNARRILKKSEWR